MHYAPKMLCPIHAPLMGQRLWGRIRRSATKNLARGSRPPRNVAQDTTSSHEEPASLEIRLGNVGVSV